MAYIESGYNLKVVRCENPEDPKDIHYHVSVQHNGWNIRLGNKRHPSIGQGKTVGAALRDLAKVLKESNCKDSEFFAVISEPV